MAVTTMRLLLAFSEYRTGTLLNILQPTGESPQSKKISAQNVYGVKVEKPQAIISDTHPTTPPLKRKPLS